MSNDQFISDAVRAYFGDIYEKGRQQGFEEGFKRGREGAFDEIICTMERAGYRWNENEDDVKPAETSGEK